MAAGSCEPGPELGSLSRVFSRVKCSSKQGRIVAWHANPHERNGRTAGKASLIYELPRPGPADLAANSMFSVLKQAGPTGGS